MTRFLKEIYQHLKNAPTIEFIVTLFTLLSFVISAIYSIVTFIKAVKKKLRNRSLIKDLSYSNFSKLDVKRAIQYYIPNYYQNVSPSIDEEPGKKYVASAKSKLIPLFLNEFLNGGNGHKFYLVLADTGMGKTTFMINLYLSFLKQFNWYRIHKKSLIKLFPLGWHNTLNKIRDLPEKNETILLLDAFDEDVLAMKDYKGRLDEILKIANEFKIVIITCRTQFFPSQKEEPHETGYFSYGSANQEYVFQKLYISVFSEKDIRKYIGKRFGIFNSKKKKDAFKIIQKSPDLAVRPMLLYHITDLVEKKHFYNYSYEIYAVLIEKWIEREYNKPGTRKAFSVFKDYRDLFYSFSYALSADIYMNRNKRKGFYINSLHNFSFNSSNNFNALVEIQEINDTAEIKIGHQRSLPFLTDVDKTSKSLLNRDTEGNYKFSHKSIMEFFLAIELFCNQSFYKSFDFKGMNATDKFLIERINEYLKKNTIYLVPTFEINHTKENYSTSFDVIQIRLDNSINPLVLERISLPNILFFIDFPSSWILHAFYAIYLTISGYNLSFDEDANNIEEFELKLHNISLAEVVKDFSRLYFMKPVIEHLEKYNITEKNELKNAQINDLTEKPFLNAIKNIKKGEWESFFHLITIIDKYINNEYIDNNSQFAKEFEKNLSYKHTAQYLNSVKDFGYENTINIHFWDALKPLGLLAKNCYTLNDLQKRLPNTHIIY